MHELGGRLQIERLTLLGEHERRDGVYVLLLHTLYLHLTLERGQRVYTYVAEIAQARQAPLRIFGILSTHIVRVAFKRDEMSNYIDNLGKLSIKSAKSDCKRKSFIL